MSRCHGHHPKYIVVYLARPMREGPAVAGTQTARVSESHPYCLITPYLLSLRKDHVSEPTQSRQVSQSSPLQNGLIQHLL